MLSPKEKQELSEAAAETAGLLDRYPLEGPWDAEQAAMSLPMLAHPDVPGEVAEIFVSAFAGRADPAAAAVLKAQERLAHPPLRDHARAAAARLAEMGVVSSFEDEIGNLGFVDGAIFRQGDAETIALCLMQRPTEAGTAQVAIVFLDWGTGAVTEVDLADPEPLKEARKRFNLQFDEVTRRKASRGELLSLLERALGADEPLLDEMLFDLAILERALTGEDMRLPRPPVYPLEDPEGEEAEGPAGRLVEQMISEGVDPDDRAALAEWMEDFNSRPYEERLALTGGRSVAAPGPSPKRKQKRRQAKAARKRNRRR